MRRTLSRPITLAAVAVALGGCVDEKIVFRDRPIFDEPVPAAAGFLGYSNVAAKQTTCGNCHVGQHARWKGTAHADAWATLTAEQQANPACTGCHSTNSLGNQVAGQSGGYLGDAQARYHDVQCESCHGPGLPHVMNPDARGTRPYASLAVNATTGCGECHSGAHQPFVEEWSRSGHGVVVASPGGRAECQECHTGENALKSWGIQANYAGKDSLLNSNTANLPITCGVCHDPHDATNQGQLRFSITVPSEENNLCMKCHHKRGNPDPTTFRGPHSPQGPLLLGYAGNWFPPMQFPDTIQASHGSARNPRLCAGCHVNQYEVRDQLTGAFVARSVGHTFQAIPCLDAQGLPTPGPCEAQQRTFKTCTAAGCHANEASARAIMGLSEQRIADLTEELDLLLRRLTANWRTCRSSGNCPGTEFHGSDGRWTVAEGAAFNYELAIQPGSSVHNPILIEVLLRSSIREVRRAYDLPAQTRVSLEPMLGGK